MADFDFVAEFVTEFCTDFGNNTETGNTSWFINQDDLVFEIFMVSQYGVCHLLDYNIDLFLFARVRCIFRVFWH